MLRLAALGPCLAAIILFAGASARPISSHRPMRLSVRYAPVVAHFDSIVDRVPRDSVRRWLDAVEAAAPRDSDLRILTGCQRAVLLVQAGRFEPAVRLAGPALARARTTRDTLLECRALYVTALAAALSARPASARSIARRSLALARAIGRRRDAAQARLMLAYLDLLAGRLAESEHGYRAALRDLSPSLDVVARRIARVGLARACFQQGRYEEARRADIELIRDSRHVNDPVNEAIAFNNLAEHELAAGDPSDAVACFRRALELQRRARQFGDALTTGTNLADALARLGREQEAAQVLESVSDTAGRGVLPAGRVALLTARARAELRQRRTAGADTLFARAWGLCDSALLVPSHDLVTGRAQMLARGGRVTEAMELLDHWAAGPHPAGRTSEVPAVGRAAAAQILCDAGRPAEALRRWLGVCAGLDTATAAGCAMSAQALLGESRAARAAGDVARARAALLAAAGVWERARARMRAPEWREVLESAGADDWGAAAGALLDRRPGERPGDGARAAFDLLQRVKARTLEERAEAGRGARALDADRLQREVLRDGELALDLFPAGDSVLVFAVTRRALRAVILPDESGLRERIARFADLARDRSPEAAALRETAARGLATALLAPLADLVAPCHRLIVSGGGATDELPWALLPEPHSGLPLIERVEVSTTPSLSTLARLRLAALPGAASGPLVLAGPRGPDGRTLRGVEDEVRWLSQHYAAAEVRAPRTASDLRGALAALPKADAIHLAAHFADDPDDPWRSGVLLGDPGRDESWLRPSALAAVRMRARLAVLAGCASASAHGTGLSAERGLASAFLASGTKAVVGTLWPVEDGASSEFVHRFYRALDEGRDAAGAVAQAQLGMRASAAWRAPAQWAAFVLLGDPAVRLALPRRTFPGLSRWPGPAGTGR